MSDTVSDAAEMTENDVGVYPRPCTAIPTSVSFSPDDSKVGFLHSGEGSLTCQLYSFDVASKRTRQCVTPPHNGGDTEANLSLEEKLRRERQRCLSLGITNYQWTSCPATTAAKGGVSEQAAVASRLLVPLQGNVYAQDGDGPLRLIVVSKGCRPLSSPRVCACSCMWFARRGHR